MDIGTIDPRVIWIGAAILGVLIVGALIARGSRRSRSAQLREQFGTEYEHTVKETGSRKKAEQALLTRAEEVKQFEIRPLVASDRERYVRDWAKVERHFLERPTMAVAEADELVADVMRVMGYPMGDFEHHAAHLSVTHPRVIEHYRAGHRVITGAPGSATTEDLRQAMLHYRALYEELVGERTDVARDVPAARETVAREMPRENEVTTPGRIEPLDSDFTPPPAGRPGPGSGR